MAPVVCEEGHLLQGYVQESNETHEVSQHVTQSRRLRKRRIKKYRPPSNAQFHGERGTFLLFQALQWILREQVRVMIDELGFPPELEGVTRDLWGLYLASSGVPNAPADYLAGNEPASSYCGPRAGARYTVKGRPSKAAKREGTADAGDEGDGSDVDGEMTDADRTAGSGSDADDSDTDASDDVDVVPVSSPQPDATSPTASSKIKTAQGIKAPPKKQRKTSFGYNAREQPRMDTLLVILYLACCTLRFPVFTKDVLHLAETHQILYLNAQHRLPTDLLRHLNVEHRHLLDQSSIATVYRKGEHHFIERVGALHKMYQDDWGITFPEPNLPFLCWRLCHSLACPPLFYVYVKRVLATIGDITLAPHKNNTRQRPRPGSSDAKAQSKAFSEPPEFVLAATLVIVLKLVYGLDDGAPWLPLDADDPLAHLPPVDDWLSTITEIERLERDGDVSTLWSKEVSDMTSRDIDAYLDFFEDCIEPNNILPSRMKDIDRFFPAPSTAARPPRPSIAASSSRIDQLFAELYSQPSPLPLHLSDAEQQRDHASSRPYHHYAPTSYATLPRRFDIVVSRLASLIGTTTLEVMHAVKSVEGRLLVGTSKRSHQDAHEDPDRLHYLRSTTGLFLESDKQHYQQQPGPSRTRPGQPSRLRAAAESKEKVKDVARWRDERWARELARRDELKKLVASAPKVGPGLALMRPAKTTGATTAKGKGKELAEDNDGADVEVEDGLVFKSQAWIDSEDDEDGNEQSQDAQGAGGQDGVREVSAASTRDNTPNAGGNTRRSSRSRSVSVVVEIPARRKRRKLENGGAEPVASGSGQSRS